MAPFSVVHAPKRAAANSLARTKSSSETSAPRARVYARRASTCAPETTVSSGWPRNHRARRTVAGGATSAARDVRGNRPPACGAPSKARALRSPTTSNNARERRAAAETLPMCARNWPSATTSADGRRYTDSTHTGGSTAGSTARIESSYSRRGSRTATRSSRTKVTRPRVPRRTSLRSAANPGSATSLEAPSLLS